MLAETHVDILDSVERDGRGCRGGDTGQEGAPTGDAEATQLERHRQKLQASQPKWQHPVARYRPAGIADVEPLPSSARLCVSSRPSHSFQLEHPSYFHRPIGVCRLTNPLALRCH